MFKEHEAKRILERAIELDAELQGSLSRDELVQLAAQVGVSHISVDAAITERDNPGRLQRGHVNTASWRALTLGAATGMVVCGIVTGVVPASTTGARLAGGVASIVTLATLAANIALSSRIRSIRTFVRQNGLFWVGMFAGALPVVGAIGTFRPVPGVTALDLFPWVAIVSVNGLVLSTLLGSFLHWLLVEPDITGADAAKPDPYSGRSQGRTFAAKVKKGVVDFAGRLTNWLG